MKKQRALVVWFALFCLPHAVAGELDGVRGSTDIDALAPAAPVGVINKEERRQTRNYPEQPPIIPHAIDGYQINLGGNKCLSCHSRQQTAATGAPMPSITHFMDRDLQVLSDISPRRYFCTQCHVTQTTKQPPIGNTFIDGADLTE